MVSLDKISKLLKDVVVLKLLERPTGTESGLLIPENHRVGIEYAIRGKIVKMGSKFRYKDILHIGDIVFVPSQFGNPLNRLDESIRFYDGEDILCVEQKEV